jgi:hypothetical protein
MNKGKESGSGKSDEGDATPKNRPGCESCGDFQVEALKTLQL